MTAATDQDLRDVSTQVESLLSELGAASDVRVQRQAEELVRLLTQLYGSTLERVVEITVATGGEELLGHLAGDDLVASMLVLHDLHPEDTAERVQRALERVRPYLGSHAGGVQLLGIDEDSVVHLRLEGNCDGCPSSAATVKYAIEGAIGELAPEVSSVQVLDSSTDPRGSSSQGESDEHHAASGTQSAVIPVGSLFRECPVPGVGAGSGVRGQS